MTSKASSAGGFDKLPATAWDPETEYKKLLPTKEYQDVLSEDDTLTQNAARVIKKLQLAIRVNNTLLPEGEARTQAESIVYKFIDELINSLAQRQAAQGEKVRVGFLALSVSAPAEIEAALAKAKAVNAPWFEAHEKDFETIIGHFSLPGNMKDGTFVEGEKEEKGFSYLSSYRWMNQPSIDGDLVKADWEIFRKIHAIPGTKEQDALDAVERNMRKLYEMDKTNLTFVNTAPSLKPGARFAASFLLAGIGLFSLLMARKTNRLPIKGLMAVGLLLYLNRNRDSKLSFLSGPRYESLTKELQGSDEGKIIFQALGDAGNRTALKEFSKRERSRSSLPVTQRKDLPDSTESYTILIDEMGFKKESVEAKKLRAMPFSDIDDLSTILQRFSPEELEIAEQFVRRKINPAKAVADIPIAEPGA